MDWDLSESEEEGGKYGRDRGEGDGKGTRTDLWEQYSIMDSRKSWLPNLGWLMLDWIGLEGEV